MRFGIVGTNFISDNFATACLRAGHIPYAVYSRAESTGAEFAKKHGIEKVYTSYTDMLDSSGIDAIYIASPTMCHAEQTIEALKRGIPCLTEKMITATMEEFLLLKAAKVRYGGVLIEAMRPDFDDMIDVLKENLHRVGKIKSASLEYRQYSSRYDKFKSGTVLNAFDPKMKNSALADIGIYPLHVAVSLFGEPSSIESRSVFLHNGFEGEGEAILNYGDFLCKIKYSKIVEGENISVIEGELGSITVDKINEPRSVIFTDANGKRTVFEAAPDKSNMVREVSDFCDIAHGNYELCEKLFSVTEATMRCVGKIYESNGIEKHF